MTNLTDNGNENSPEMIRAVRAEISLGKESVDAYLLPNGDKRLGFTGISNALGYSKEWFGRLHKTSPKRLKALQEDGFTGCTIEVQIGRDEEKGSALAKTVCIEDFIKLVTYEALNGNRKAIVLMAAFSHVGLDRILDDVFQGKSIQFLLDRIEHYTKWTHEEMEEVLAYNREEVKALSPWRQQG